MFRYLLDKFKRDKEFRVFIEKTLLITLIPIVIIIFILKNFVPEERTEQEGALMALMCPNPKCGYKEIRRVVSIKDSQHVCPKCGTHFQQIWRCKDCGFQFPHIKMPVANDPKINAWDLLRASMINDKCPNCGSINTYQDSIQSLKNKK